MIQLNLLPDIKKEYLKNARLKRSIILISLAVSGFFVAIVVILLSTVFIVQKQHINNLSASIEEDIQTLQSVEDLDKVLTVQNQLIVLPELHDTKPGIERIFNYIATVTPGNVQVRSVQASFSADEGELIQISGVTTSFKDVNTFADAIKNATYVAKSSNSEDPVRGNAFSSVTLESISKDDSGDSGEEAAFNLVMMFDPNIFDSSFDRITLTVPAGESSVSSTEAPKLNKQPFSEGGKQ